MHLRVLRACALLIFVVLATSFDCLAQHNTTTDPQITQKIRALSWAYDQSTIVMQSPSQPSLPKTQFL
jgi:hypothetical protein